MNLLEKYKHISFDLDGTLVHTVEEYRNYVVNTVIDALGGKKSNTRMINRFWFEPHRDLLIQNEFGVGPKKFWAKFAEVDTPAGRDQHTSPYKDAEPALYTLKRIGKIVSIVTNAPRWIAEMEVKKLNAAPYDFFMAITGSGMKNKPHPESLVHSMQQLKVAPSETLYVGNSNEDAHFAKDAGVNFLFLERNEHIFTMHSYSVGTIHSLSELTKY